MVDSAQNLPFTKASLLQLIDDSVDKFPQMRLNAISWLEEAKQKIDAHIIPANDKIVHIVCYFYEHLPAEPIVNESEPFCERDFVTVAYFWCFYADKAHMV